MSAEVVAARSTRRSAGLPRDGTLAQGKCVLVEVITADKSRTDRTLRRALSPGCTARSGVGEHGRAPRRRRPPTAALLTLTTLPRRIDGAFVFVPEIRCRHPSGARRVVARRGVSAILYEPGAEPSSSTSSMSHGPSPFSSLEAGTARPASVMSRRGPESVASATPCSTSLGCDCRSTSMTGSRSEGRRRDGRARLRCVTGVWRSVLSPAEPFAPLVQSCDACSLLPTQPAGAVEAHGDLGVLSESEQRA